MSPTENGFSERWKKIQNRCSQYRGTPTYYSINSIKKAEPFKMWLAEVGRERIDEIVDPEIAIDRALETYARKGYDADCLIGTYTLSHCVIWNSYLIA